MSRAGTLRMNHGPIEHYARPRELLAAAVRSLPVSLALVTCALTPARAGPEGANVVTGHVTVEGTANVTVTQFSQKAIVNWNTFNIGTNERTQFVQPNSSSVILNRDGFVFGAGAVISTASFLATTSDIHNNDFMAGRYNFSIPGRPDASI